MGKQPSKLTNEEYESLFREWLVEQGPNQGKGMYGRMAWQQMKEKEFRKKLISEGRIESDIPKNWIS